MVKVQREKIEQDLANISQKSAQLGEKLRLTYHHYGEQFVQALSQQTIQACYLLCTHGYPDEFLNLTFSQREKLQVNIKDLIKLTIADILFPLNMNQEQYQEMINAHNPVNIYQWCINIDRRNEQNLKNLSHQLNKLFHEGQIIKESIPEQVLESAEENDFDRDNSLGTHIVTIKKQEDNNLTKSSKIEFLYVISLKRSTIDFTNFTLSKIRQEIHQLITELKKTIQSYQEKERELKIVEAEAKWRLTWTND